MNENGADSSGHGARAGVRGGDLIYEATGTGAANEFRSRSVELLPLL
jgi:hypothetical protein